MFILLTVIKKIIKGTQLIIILTVNLYVDIPVSKSDKLTSYSIVLSI